MSYTSPTTRSPGYKVKAVGDWNILVNDIKYLKGESGAITLEDSVLISKSIDGGHTLSVQNVNTGTGAIAAIRVQNDTGSTDGLRLFCYGKSWTTSGMQVQDGANVEAGANLSGGLSIGAAHASGVIRFFTGGTGSGNQRLEIDASGDITTILDATFGLNAYSHLSFWTGDIAALQSRGSARVVIDSENNSTSETFSVEHNAADGFSDILMSLSESGRMRLAGYHSLDELSATPADPSDGIEVNIYMKSNKLVICYNDGGTVRYKYLTLSGTGDTWTHTTTPP